MQAGEWAGRVRPPDSATRALLPGDREDALPGDRGDALPGDRGDALPGDSGSSRTQFIQSPGSPCLGMITWRNLQMVNPERHDRRLNHFRVCSDIILYKAKMWGFREDDRHK
ncbi:cilia- and flagella-associated protein 144 isoform X3 [Callithrix jacchus]|uniref:cilia- and flagella-associated protein 144 isoform X3 n=1 Tax=Callithrix jacchus TaxID=9483 RepID=UPI0008401B77|nr:cilia- and flagella-associated protein 144 isoform X3 [Callithrix jacchus]